jgi:hypothetical protein
MFYSVPNDVHCGDIHSVRVLHTKHVPSATTRRRRATATGDQLNVHRKYCECSIPEIWGLGG